MNTKTPTAMQIRRGRRGFMIMRADAVAHTMKTTQSSREASQRRSSRRSSPPSSETAPSRSDGNDLTGVMGAYLQIFSRPPLGDHPQMDGFVAGRVLAEEYPDEMQRVMSGIRAGIKEGTEESAAKAGGQTDG